MENSAHKDNEAKATAKHPEASEDVQLNIETVTPDTEPEGLTTEQKEENGQKSNEVSENDEH
jgi:hypothetical protein